MKVKDLKNKKIKDLKVMLEEKREEERVMRFKVSQRQLKKVHELERVKRDIARLKTVIADLGKKELAK